MGGREIKEWNCQESEINKRETGVAHDVSMLAIRFFCVWDDRQSMYGDQRKFVSVMHLVVCMLQPFARAYAIIQVFRFACWCGSNLNTFYEYV